MSVDPQVLRKIDSTSIFITSILFKSRVYPKGTYKELVNGISVFILKGGSMNQLDLNTAVKEMHNLFRFR